MKIICDQCGENIQPLSNYCSYCGSESPRKTVLLTEKLKLNDPVFCPSCGKPSYSDSLYCSWCGIFLFEKPDKDIVYCPKCKSKNRIEAKICSVCKYNISDWFQMRGVVSEDIGIPNNLIIHETMNDVYYHFLSDQSLTIGADPSSNIHIACPWVSSKHLTIDHIRKKIIDNKSTNGTYINRTSRRITEESIYDVKEFNLAGAFTFTTIIVNNAVSIRLTAILDEAECKKVGNLNSINKLRKYYYIMLFGDTKIYIRRMDGEVCADDQKDEKMQLIEFAERYFYFSNLQGNIKNRLITKKYSTLPANWKIILEDK